MRNLMMIVVTVACVSFLTNTASAGTVPYGVLNDVSVDTVLNDWEWEIVYQDNYAAGSFNNSLSIDTVLSGLKSGDVVMLAAIESGSASFDVLAATTYDELTTVTGTSLTHASNGAEWYFNSLSMGFAGLGDTITQGSADTYGPAERDRLSWHTSADAGRSGGIAPDYLWAGWRSGSNTSLNNSTTWDRVVLKYTAIPEPSTLAFIGIFGSGIFAVRRIFLI